MTGSIIDCLYAAGLLVSSPLWLYRMVRHGRYPEDVSDGLGDKLDAAVKEYQQLTTTRSNVLERPLKKL